MGLNNFFNEIEADIDYNHLKISFEDKFKILRKLNESYGNSKDLEKIQYISLFVLGTSFHQFKEDSSKRDMLEKHLKWCNKKYQEYLDTPK